MKNHLRPFLALLLTALSLLSLVLADSVPAEEDPNCLAYYADKTICDLTGSIGLDHLRKLDIFGADQTVDYYNSNTDCITAVRTGNADAFVCDLSVAMIYCHEYPDLMIVEEHVTDDDHFGFALRKGSDLTEPFNECIARLWADGTIDALNEKWIVNAGEDSSMPEITWPGSNGTLRFWCTGTTLPTAYTVDGEVVGYTVELFYRICEMLDYTPVIYTSDFSGLIPALVSDRADVAGDGISITEERKQSVDMTDPIYHNAGILLVRDPDYVDESDSSFADTVKASFVRTFVSENRWKMFLSGISCTLLVTGFSIVCGTALGFGIYLLTRRKWHWLNALLNGIGVFLTGIPVVVVLMVGFYIIFGSSGLSGTLISCFVFTLLFAVQTVSVIESGVAAVGGGQYEGAMALGYTDTQAFFRVLLPQAVLFALPSYRSSLISLLKDTAIVGYVAVMDLTRAGDVVRGATLDPFFALIAVALIYFVLGRILVRLVDLLHRILKGKQKAREASLKEVSA